MKWKNIENKYASRIEELRNMTPHQLLEVGENATKQEIRRAYRRKIKLYHPDNADEFMRDYCQEVTKLINIAYEELLKSINE